jgi:hypothetical protein
MINTILRRISWIKKGKAIKKEIERRGGKERVIEDRVKRQNSIREEKRAIIGGLLISWDLKEIREPSREEYLTLKWYYRGLTIKYLRDLERRYWN